jgi:hypothetical protein
MTSPIEPKDGFTVTEIDLGILNLHLVSGEDIIGRVYDKTDPLTGGEYYVVDKPVIPTLGQGEDGKLRVGMMPLRPYLGGLKQVELAKAYVMYPVKVNPQMEVMYTEFTSGILIATPGQVPTVKL